jgi:hypothetical protein
LLSVDDDWYARTAKVPVLHRWLRVQKRSCRIAGKQAYEILRYKPPAGPTFSMSQSFRSTTTWYSCSLGGMDKEVQSWKSRTAVQFHGVSSVQYLMASLICVPFFVPVHQPCLYSTSDIFSSVFAALRPPDHFSSFFSQSIVCMALERKMSALKLARRLHFPPRASISDCEGNVFSKALCLMFWI